MDKAAERAIHAVGRRIEQRLDEAVYHLLLRPMAEFALTTAMLVFTGVGFGAILFLACRRTATQTYR